MTPGNDDAVLAETVPERPTIFVRRQVDAHALQGFQGEALASLLVALAATGGRADGSPYVRYHSFDEAGADVEMGLTLASAVPDGGVVEAGILPGGRQVTVVHHGDHDGLAAAYAALRAAVEAGGDEAAGPPWEVYHWIDPDQPLDPAAWPPPAEWRTTLVQPVRSA